MHEHILIILIDFVSLINSLILTRVPGRVGVALQRRFPLVDGLWVSEGYLESDEQRSEQQRAVE